MNADDADFVSKAKDRLQWAIDRIEVYQDAVESLYQIIQRGDLTSFDLKQADDVTASLQGTENCEDTK